MVWRAREAIVLISPFNPIYHEAFRPLRQTQHHVMDGEEHGPSTSKLRLLAGLPIADVTLATVLAQPYKLNPFVLYFGC